MAFPLWLKVAQTLFVGIWAGIWWVENGVANFLWFSDLAMFATVPALWLSSRTIASVAALAVVFLEAFWALDLVAQLIAGREVFGLAAYMFDPAEPTLVRALSFAFHIEMPVLLLLMLRRWGYDQRALWIQTLVCWVVLPVTYLASKPNANVNWVFGLGSQPQESVPPLLYLTGLALAFPILVYLPSHIALRKLFAKTP